MRVLILGLGNILLTDEGVGVHAVEAFEKAYVLPDGVDAVDGGTSGMDLIDIMEGYDVVIVVDAVRTGLGAGEVDVLRNDDVPKVFRQGLSPHQLGLPDVLAAMALLDIGPPRLVLVGTEPVEIKPGIGLSPTVAATIPVILDRLAEELGRLGIPVSAKPASPGPAHAAANRNYR